MPIRSQLQNDSNIEHQTNNQKENQKKKNLTNAWHDWRTRKGASSIAPIFVPIGKPRNTRATSFRPVSVPTLPYLK